jgi:hypothetical protein
MFSGILEIQVENDRGFSGVVGAIDGFLLMSILRTFAQNQKEGVAVLSTGLYVSYLFIGLGILTSRLIILGLGVSALILVFNGTRTEYIARPEQLSRWGAQNIQLSIIIIISIFVSTLVFAVSLPADIITSSGAIKNIVAHGAGILFGMNTEIAVHYIDRWIRLNPVYR